MPRTKIIKRTRRQLQLEREEQHRLAEMKLESALLKIEDLGKRTMQHVDYQLQRIVARTPQHVLQMKWSEFLKLDLNRFDDFQFIAPAPPPPQPQRSHSNCTRSGRMRTPQQSQVPRLQVQSVDRAVLKKADLPAVAFLRWPKPGEVALSKCGSPLAVQSFPDRCANVHIPTKLGVLKMKPQKMSEVKREVLKQLDSETLNQIKTLNSNLHMIVDMANQLRK
ncbi:borealin [Drosophila innubila]|uniref:borealin n=1 Tax=Drosophila innubila TaxID=198719 RepID=UPI00148C42D4|nr:borealin [Drosophila innubila]